MTLLELQEQVEILIEPMQELQEEDVPHESRISGYSTFVNFR